MKRVLMGVVAGVVVLSGVFATSVALAGPSGDTTITLSCDKNASATISVDLLTSTGGLNGGTDEMSCGPGSSHARILLEKAEAAASAVVAFEVTVGSSTSDCGGSEPVPVPARIDCSADGRAGARLVVR